MALTLRRATRTMMTVAAVGASSALVACGGGEEASGDDEGASFEDAQVEFTECMRENGVDMPDPEPGDGPGIRIQAGEEGGIDPSSESFQAASEECGQIIEDSIPEGERPDPAEIRDQLHEMTECLRDEGYDVPEPTIVGPGEDPPEQPQSGGPGGELEELQDDPEFQQAQDDCSAEAGLDEGFGPGGPGGPGGESTD
jgi:hypothetical protein